MARYCLFLLLTFLLSFSGSASHVMGGDITWTCQGGDYVFQLVFYRDCNGAEVNTLAENIRVWNHPTVTNIPVNFISREDISPICTEVAGGPSALLCGTGANGGNGNGAIEKIIYRSNPITLPGTPPAGGWIFTFDVFSRNGSITNLQNPNTYGVTLAAKIYAVPNAGSGCVDNSPQFLQDPYFVSCVGDSYEYNMNAVDPDLDSLAISFGTPYDYFPAGSYNPPSNPAPVPFEPGFNTNSPTPGTGMNPGNIPAAIHPTSGNLTFLSNNVGNFVVKVIAKSYRQGVLIAETEREMQLIVQNCNGTNTKPVITGPFGGLFETTINAGDLVNFNLSSTDVELLQNGSPQSNILTATGLMFGTNYTNPTGCAIAPCATLNFTPPITMPQGTSTTFTWQTSCDHVVNPFGYAVDQVPYHFVFKIQDDFCPIPKVSYATITINVINPGVIDAPEISCIQTDAAGNTTINWTPVIDPFGTFMGYEVYSLQNGLIASIPGIGTASYTDPGAGLTVNDYYVSVVSGCNGNTFRNSDTLQNIYLDVVNPTNGTAVLNWNDPSNPALSSMNGYYHIYREYPAGVWTLYDSVPYGTNNFIDTIDICSVYLNYQIQLPNGTGPGDCPFISNIDGDNFEDMMTPAIPNVANVTIDTLTNMVNITWDVNTHQDTYGYVIYTLDANGVPVEIDTVWGRTNVTYSHSTITSDGPLTYTVAAFDSCWTVAVPPTYQTSAKANLHTTIFTTASLDICAKQVRVSWSDYIGWNQIDSFNVYGFEIGNPWSLIGSTSSTSFTVDVNQQSTYCFVVEGISDTGERSFSNISCIYIGIPRQPDQNYLSVATVNGSNVVLRYLIDVTANVQEVIFEKADASGVFEELVTLSVTSGSLSYTDTDVNVDEQSYSYRVLVIDSCGQLGEYSNIARTLFLNVQLDELLKLNYLNWNPYIDFDGSILAYNIYRGIDGVFTGGPIATLTDGNYSFEDDVNGVVGNGEICYYVEAIEAINSYGINEVSRSNIGCSVLSPIIYIPNAFVPDGINKVFIPVVADFDLASYDFTVFSRWGQPIFKTNSIYEGWDGTINLSGNMAQNGTYLYVVSLRDGAGNEVVKRGHVTLVK